jgi:hypothetical protein
LKNALNVRSSLVQWNSSPRRVPASSPCACASFRHCHWSPLRAARPKAAFPSIGRLHDGYLANLCLRTANRVLMRIGAFTASNFFTLEKKLAATPWELYLHPGQPLRFNVTARHSRLYHGVAIAERFQKAIDARWAEAGVDPKPNESAALGQQIFIRVVDDHFAVSLDSSGESLYRRGLKKQVTAAPSGKRLRRPCSYWRDTHRPNRWSTRCAGRVLFLSRPRCGRATFPRAGSEISPLAAGRPLRSPADAGSTSKTSAPNESSAPAMPLSSQRTSTRPHARPSKRTPRIPDCQRPLPFPTAIFST